MKTKRTLIYKLIRNVLICITSIFILSIIVFYMSRLSPGDPLVSYYGEKVERMSQDERDKASEKLGLDKPIYVQYVRWIEGASKGEFGLSFKYKQDVLKVLGGRVNNTLILGGIGFVLIFALAILVSILCSFYEGKLIDKIICQIGNITSFIPEFWFSLILILIFSVNLKLLPSSGAYSIGMDNDIGDRLIHLILPLTVVVVSHLWYYAYIFRNRMINELRKDYVVLAKSKGSSKKKIVWAHCLKNIMPTVISTMAIAIPHIIAGTYVVESVFSYPGIGSLAFESAKYHDYNMLMVICIITGCITILSNIVANAINEKINPKIQGIEG